MVVAIDNHVRFFKGRIKQGGKVHIQIINTGIDSSSGGGCCSQGRSIGIGRAPRLLPIGHRIHHNNTTTTTTTRSSSTSHVVGRGGGRRD